MRRPNQRQPGIDALKGLACSLIIWHHLAFYGPMSDVLYPHLSELTDWLYGYGRMAVQVFLVVGGFLAAGSLAPQGVAVFGSPLRLIWRRYQRLALPYGVALGASVLVAAVVRPWFAHPSVSDDATLLQFLAHLLLLQDVLDHEALSAGVWYVAIDFQLFCMSVATFSLTRRLGRWWPAAPRLLVPAGIGGVLVLAVLSLFFFNRQAELDHTGLYFFGAYALGMLAFWVAQAPRRGAWLLLIGALGGLALMLDFRGRLLVALGVAFGLVWLQSGGSAARHAMRLQPFGWLVRLLARLGTMSYSVFLIHFPVCLLVNAVVTYFWPTQVLANALGLLAAFGLSLWAGQVLYQRVEAGHGRLLGLIKSRLIRSAT
ncbi:MAG: acyltransferase [Pseudomonadota bacterium]|nr:acyltransferase [Pseudomonadota bacterium]